MIPRVGTIAPSFSLPDQEGVVHTLGGNKGKWMLLYFYPKDDTPGCTVEACQFRDRWHDLQTEGVVVLGISADSAERHKKFAAKNDLPFPLLADVEKKVIERYGVWGKKKFLGKTYDGILRTSFLIDPEGKIAKVYEKVKPAIHAQEVLDDVREHKENLLRNP